MGSFDANVLHPAAHGKTEAIMGKEAAKWIVGFVVVFGGMFALHGLLFPNPREGMAVVEYGLSLMAVFASVAVFAGVYVVGSLVVGGEAGKTAKG